MPIYHSKQDGFLFIPSLSKSSAFFTAKRYTANFGHDSKGGYISYSEFGLHNKKVYLDCAYLAYHGGDGEGGQMQGLFESLQIPITSASTESSAICINKVLTKQVLKDVVPILDFISINSEDVRDNSQNCSNLILDKFQLPVIVKPAHLGSSIGIKVCKTKLDLEKALLEIICMDTEILIEPYMTNFFELNISVTMNGDKLVFSPIEKPITKNDILTFDDKYGLGAKKFGNSGGMVNLDREIPANISPGLSSELIHYAELAYKACRCSGLLRIDFMICTDENSIQKVYLTEINTIPGSLAFYIWEAAGINFTEQITQSIENAIIFWNKKYELELDYKTDILDKFVNYSKK